MQAVGINQDFSSSVKRLGDYAFFDCIGLTALDILNSVTRIGDYAFQDCTGLTTQLGRRTARLPWVFRRFRQGS